MKELENILNEKSEIKQLNEILKNGGVISFVTDTVWGLGCLPSSSKGVDKIYEIKGRDRSKPLILMSNNVDYLFPYLDTISDTAKKLTDKYFPGALTIVSKKSHKTPSFVSAGLDTVGIRVPDNKFFQKLCSVIEGNVLATTSANLSNMPSAKSCLEAQKSIGHLVDMVFDDYGFHCMGRESTVLSVVDDKIKILRQGSIFINLN